MNRDDLIAGFLSRHGYSPDAAEPLAQDASFRRYLRIRGDRPAVLMDAPPPEDVRPFLHIAAHLHAAGLAVPAIIAADEGNGLVLEQDLGDDLLSVLLDRGDEPNALLDPAIDALVIMQRAAPPPDLPAWDAATMAATAAGTLFDWWWPARFGSPAMPCCDRSPRAQDASSIATSSPATCSGCPPAKPASSTSKAPPSAIRPTIWCHCCRTPAATFPPPPSAAHLPVTSPPGPNWIRRRSRRPLPRVRRSATCVSPANGSGLRCATAGRNTLAMVPARGENWPKRWPNQPPRRWQRP